MIKDNDFIHLPELYLTLESLKKHIKQHYNLNITNMANENKHSGYNDEQMAMTQLDIIHRYSVKLETMISEGAYLEEWVKMKLSRVESMIASVKHALEGVEKFEDGGELARKQLLHISKYSAKLIEMLKEGSVLMSWMESNIAICADYMDGIYHHLDYKMGNRAKQMEYRNGGGVGRTHTLLEKRISSIGDQSTKAGRKDRFNVVVGYINEAYDNKEISKAEAIDFYKQAVEETDYLNEDKAFESKFNVTEYNNGGGVGIPNNYEGKTKEQVWNSWTKEQRIHFIQDHDIRKVYDAEKEANFDYDDIHDTTISDWLEEHTNRGQYAKGGGVDEIKYFYIKGRNEGAPQKLKDTYAEFYTEKDLIEYINKWKGNKDVSFNSITKVYNNGETEDVTDFYLKNSYANSGGVGAKYYVMDVKNAEIISKAFATEEEAKVELYRIFEETGNRFLATINSYYLNQKMMANGGGVDMAEKGKRIYTDWKGKKNNENWGKYNLYDKYNNILDLCADLVDFLRKTKEQLGEDYYISAKRDLLSAINNESIGYFDNGVLKFKAGGGIPNMYGGKTAEQVWDSWTESQRKHFCYDHELMDNVSWKTLKMSSEQLKRDNWGKEFGGRTSWDWIKNILQEHIEEGQYRNGGGVGSLTENDFKINIDHPYFNYEKEYELAKKFNSNNVKIKSVKGLFDEEGIDVEINFSNGMIMNVRQVGDGEKGELSNATLISGERGSYPYKYSSLDFHHQLNKAESFIGAVKLVFENLYDDVKIEYRNGGGVDSYGDMNPEQVWNNWSSAQRYHFIYDHMKESTPRTQEELSKKAYSFLPANVKQELHEHIHMGKYNAGGGVEEMREIEYADGGTIGTGKNAKALMKMDNDIWDKLNIDSGSQLYSDEKLQKKYAEELSKGLEKMGFETYTLKAADILTDWNYHALRSAMTFMGYFGEKEKNNQLEYKRETKKLGLSYYGLTPEIFTK